MPPCHTGEEAYGKKDDVLLVVQKEGTDRFHFAKLIPLLRNGERKERGPSPVWLDGQSSNSACGGGRRCSQITCRLMPLVAQGGFWDLFVHAKDLFVEANSR